MLSSLERRVLDLQNKVRKLEKIIADQQALLNTIQENPALAQAWQDLLLLMTLAQKEK